jgi:hypothetical protein
MGQALLAMRSELTSLRERQSALEAARAATQAQADVRAGASLEHEANESSAPKQDFVEHYSDQFERLFEVEAVDSSWARNAEQDLTQAFLSDSLSGSKILTASCRTTICRVEYSHEHTDARSRFREAMTVERAFQNVGIFSYPIDEEQLTFVAYVFRNGELPAPAWE